MNQLNHFSPEEHSEEIDVFNLSYPGQVPFQTGGFVVSASSLQNGRPMGGGLVAEFINLYDAQRCYETILLTNPNHEPILSEIDLATEWEKVILDSKKEESERRKREKEGREREYVRHMKNPFEFDTQARQEMFNNDTGALPNQKKVIHDYRLLKGAYEFTDYDEEPDTKGPRGITRDSRRRAIELFYEEVSIHNAETPNEEGEDSYETDELTTELAKDAWEEYYTRDERYEHFANLYENCDYQTNKSRLFLYEDDEGLEIQEEQDEKIIKGRKKLLLGDRKGRRKNEVYKIWKYISKKYENLDRPNVLRKFYKELESRKLKSKIISQKRYEGERIGQILQQMLEEEMEFFESMREMYREQITLEEEVYNEDVEYREAA